MNNLQTAIQNLLELAGAIESAKGVDLVHINNAPGGLYQTRNFILRHIATNPMPGVDAGKIGELLSTNQPIAELPDNIRKAVFELTQPNAKIEPCRASDDFSSVVWFEKPYSFNKTQALCVRLLWENWQKGCPALSEKTIGDRIGSASDSFRLIHTFRTDGKTHPAWGAMIQKAGKGLFMLAEPTGKKTQKK